MNKIMKDSWAFEAIKIMAALLVICVITRLWPLVFVVILGILAAALRLMFVSLKNSADTADKLTKSTKSGKPSPSGAPAATTAPPREYTDQDVLLIAFGILQQRITRAVQTRYPAARWIWDTPNPIECFNEDHPLTIILNRAGGYKKAIVQIHNLKFYGLYFGATDTEKRDENPDDDSEPNSSDNDTADEIDSTDYSVLAFEWLDANFVQLNTQCKTAATAGRKYTLIPTGNLPVKDSWESICLELKREGFADAVVTDGGIRVKL